MARMGWLYLIGNHGKWPVMYESCVDNTNCDSYWRTPPSVTDGGS